MIVFYRYMSNLYYNTIIIKVCLSCLNLVHRPIIQAIYSSYVKTQTCRLSVKQNS